MTTHLLDQNTEVGIDHTPTSGTEPSNTLQGKCHDSSRRFSRWLNSYSGINGELDSRGTERLSSLALGLGSVAASTEVINAASLSGLENPLLHGGALVALTVAAYNGTKRLSTRIGNHLARTPSKPGIIERAQNFSLNASRPLESFISGVGYITRDHGEYGPEDVLQTTGDKVIASVADDLIIAGSAISKFIRRLR